MNHGSTSRPGAGARLAVLALASLAALLAPPAARGKEPKGASVVLAPPKSFAAAVQAIEKATGTKASDLELKGNPLPADEGRAFRIEGHLATRLIEGSHAPFLKAGLYLFRHERSFGMGGGLDIVGLVKTTDRAALIRRVGTSDPTKQRTTEQIVAWLEALDRELPFALDEIGDDFVAGRFAAVPKDPAAVARRCAEFAPELVKGSGSAVDLLTREIKDNRTLYLIW